MSRNDLSIWSLQCRRRVIDLLTQRSKGFTPIVSEWGNLFGETGENSLLSAAPQVTSDSVLIME
jgi:hypothetical protein